MYDSSARILAISSGSMGRCGERMWREKERRWSKGGIWKFEVYIMIVKDIKYRGIMRSATTVVAIKPDALGGCKMRMRDGVVSKTATCDIPRGSSPCSVHLLGGDGGQAIQRRRRARKPLPALPHDPPALNSGVRRYDTAAAVPPALLER